MKCLNEGAHMKQILVARSSMPEYQEYIEAIKPLWDSHWLTNMGVYHHELEQLLTEYLGVSHLSLFSNGHMALELAIQAMELEGEVITTPFTFASTTHAIVRNGLTPVFCDIDPDTYTIDAEKIEELITEKTSAIIPVHVYGNICNIEKIEELARKYNLKVIYDAAHAFGVTYKGKGIGEFGDASMFSFHATKVFNTIEGGAVCYRDSAFGRRLYQLKNFGISGEELVDGIGSNAKMNEFQAIMGLCNLKHLEEEIGKRKNISERYLAGLENIAGISLPHTQEFISSNYAYLPIVVDEETAGFSRDDIHKKLKESHITARKYFYPLTSAFDCYRGRFQPNDTPIALKMSKQVLALPLYADLKWEDVNRICGIIKECSTVK